MADSQGVSGKLAPLCTQGANTRVGGGVGVGGAAKVTFHSKFLNSQIKSARLLTTKRAIHETYRVECHFDIKQAG